MTASGTGGTLLRVENLVKHFPIKRGFIISRHVGTVQAVDGVSFTVNRGETLGLVGESGCGKSTTGRLILRLLEATSGRVVYDGTDIFRLDQEAMRRFRRDLQIIFQDPYGALDPRMTVEEIIAEPLVIQGAKRGPETRRAVERMLDVVGLASYHAGRYPHEFSGGQRQRIGIARALAPRPKFIVCDEPVSALDVSIQAQIVNLLQDLQEEFNLTYLFIAHDLGVVKHISDRVAVMYLGKIVEIAAKKALYATPKHPYTQALLSAIPVPRPRARRQRQVLTGDVPSPINPPAGCRFHTRCPYAEAVCRVEEPPLREVAGGQFAACHLVPAL
ncbi:MAG: dipeptide ABC transporter ATP-binding protein [Proteobacteria bacterium]|nr:dipeptide ABC transporter ATP-binding protein [Pseudomonadota bacterium]MBI3499811.1 dipeptide ABC transporter ATP-binding protein [Pseudomonadota bacterium]